MDGSVSIDKRLEVGRKGVVCFDQVREFVDDDDALFGDELLGELVEGLVPAIDAGDAVVEVVSDLFDDFLAASRRFRPILAESGSERGHGRNDRFFERFAKRPAARG